MICLIIHCVISELEGSGLRYETAKFICKKYPICDKVVKELYYKKKTSPKNLPNLASFFRAKRLIAQFRQKYQILQVFWSRLKKFGN